MNLTSNDSSTKKQIIYFLILSIPLTISFFTHLWNPAGSPIIHTDEGHYMHRSMRVLQGNNPQDPSDRYDHPYFGQLFLGSLLKIIGYPFLLDPAIKVKSLETLYAVPRVLIGMLAIVDTFLLFKIVDIRFNRGIAFIASILFAILPYTLMTRMILLDNILIPFVLSSILLACYLKTVRNDKIVLLILASSLMMGLAIFTKIPAIAMIPLPLYLIYSTKRNPLHVIIWLIPVILITSVWPFSALSVGEFDKWNAGLLYQMNRTDKPLINELYNLLVKDPVLMIFGLAGLVIAAIKRNYFIILWIVPSLVLMLSVNYVSTFHFIPIFPALCVSVALVIYELPKLLTVKFKNAEKIAKAITILITIPIIIFTFNMTQQEVSPFLNGTIIKTEQVVTKLLNERYTEDKKEREFVSVVSNPRDIWIPKYIFDMHRNNYESYYGVRSLEKIENMSSEYLLVVDNNYRNFMKEENKRGKLLMNLYDNSTSVVQVKSGKIGSYWINDPKVTEIRTSWNATFRK